MNAVTEGRKVLLEIADLKVHFEIKDGKQWFWQPPKTLKAVDGVTLRLYEGETLGVVGESGCGKSTFARAIIGLVKATDGHVAWLGKELLGMKPDEWRAVRSDIQMIFQDPYSSLSPRMPVGEIIGEAVKVHHIVPKNQYRDYILKIMHDCGLQTQYYYRYPHEFSGGMRQRAALLRTYLSSNGVALLDEPFSALDTITKTAIHKWYLEVMQHIDLSTIFITHDIDEAILLSDRIYILNGKPGEIRDEIVIKEKKPRAEDFYLTDQFLAYKRKIIAKL